MNRRYIVGVGACLTLGFIACGGEPAVDQGQTLGDGGSSGDSAGGGSGDEQSGAVGGDTANPIFERNTPIFNIPSVDAGTEQCTGGECEDIPTTLCGNGQLNEGEQCDDSNLVGGDGCTGLCNLEANFDCQSEGDDCVSTIVCGDQEVGPGEACDDGNVESSDGCSATCQVEGGFGCGSADGGGSDCNPLEVIACGDGVVSRGEQCDDNDAISGDGCSELCQVENSFTCPNAGQECELIERCGDGLLIESGVNAEECDDGNNVSNDGCSSLCVTDPDHACPTVGQLCVSTIVCHDGVLTGGEQCDDGGQCEAGANAGLACTSDSDCPSSACEAVGGDGCTAQCLPEAGFSCTGGGAEPAAGACTAIPEEICGDNRLAATEFCDDGNLADGDGCSAACTTEAGFECVSENPGERTVCTETAFCGDGVITAALGEQCDDNGQCVGGENEGNACDESADCPDSSCAGVGGDGCAAGCIPEANFVCPTAGEVCVSTIVCGNGTVEGDETCDVQGVGCSDCQVDDGFLCTGGVCLTTCGDGIRVGNEQCDDGNANDFDGCGADCRLEDGFKCEDPQGAGDEPEDVDICTPTTCQDGSTEGTEQCDNGLDVPFDGCDANCRNEPTCGEDGAGEYECDVVCGDGMKFPLEECDDGNTNDNDGCSAVCLLEPGFECTDALAQAVIPCEEDANASCLLLPIVLRDFSSDHAHFEVGTFGDGVADEGGLRQGIVEPQLNANSRPEYNQDYEVANVCGGQTRAITMDDPSGATVGGQPAVCNVAGFSAIEAAATFAEWYDSTSAENIEDFQTIELEEIEAGVFRFERTGETQFFPLDDDAGGVEIGFGQEGRANNFHFTSEVRQAFLFDPLNPPTLIFRGDDDVWVYIDGRLTLDLGGVHSELTGLLQLGGANPQACVSNDPLVDIATTAQVDVDAFIANINVTCVDFDQVLDPNDVHELAVFQAERQTQESNYTLTLQGFDAPVTSCNSVCGDGVVTAGEACDLGFDDGEALGANNTGEYETCNGNCTLTARCGDAEVDTLDGEACDNGLNNSTYQRASGDCAAGCQLPAECGDGNVDGSEGETCDDGSANNVGGYERCNSNCTLGPRCGDSVVQEEEGEECEGGVGCLADCTLICGNGQLDQGEECDEGLANNLGGYEQCNSDCTLGPRCGDGQRDDAFDEDCDDGLNDGSYGTCEANCNFASFCGDGIVDEDGPEGGEVCDDGTPGNQADGYGATPEETGCSTTCRPIPFCGDGQVNTSKLEGCDDSVNSGEAGSCEVDCSAPVPLASCGDGTVNSGEVCDEGDDNGSNGGTCDASCRLACGNGFVDVGEDCDDGTNDGSYGTCSADCTLAPFCGDGSRAASFESCDNGGGNIDPASAFGDGVCTTQCGIAPRCGDGRIDATFGEVCDGTAGCSNTCQPLQ